MKLGDLQSNSETSLDLVHPVSGKPIGVTITGYTPDSSEWKQAEARLIQKRQSIIFEKGKSRIELDGSEAEKRRELLTEVVTNLVGIDDWTFTPKGIRELFADPLYSWMFEQWADHLDDRANFFGKQGKTVKSG